LRLALLCALCWPLIGGPVTPIAAASAPVRSDNAAWLGVEWLHEPQTDAAIGSLADDLRQCQIRSVYVYASYLRADGTFNPTYEHAAAFTQRLKKAYPELSIQAWIGLPLAHTQALSGIKGYVQLDDPATRALVIAFGAALLRAGGFDGLHLDPEPVQSGDTAVLTLLEEMRAAIGPHATLSLATRRMSPLGQGAASGWLSGYAWSADYYREVARRVDQVAVMTYDSALPSAGLYRWFTRRQVIQITRALAQETVGVYIGVPTSEERTLTHRPRAENMTSGLQGVLDGLDDPRAVAAAVTGVAIYPYWETDAAEWAAYQKLWLGE
jgi:hypothetical protein